MKIAQTLQKVGKVAGAVVAGYSDYSKKMNTINATAQKNSASSMGISESVYAGKVGSEMNRLKKEQNVSLKNSIRQKLGL